jgi:hypothetical protein
MIDIDGRRGAWQKFSRTSTQHGGRECLTGDYREGKFENCGANLRAGDSLLLEVSRVITKEGADILVDGLNGKFFIFLEFVSFFSLF